MAILLVVCGGYGSYIIVGHYSFAVEERLAAQHDHHLRYLSVWRRLLPLQRAERVLAAEPLSTSLIFSPADFQLPDVRLVRWLPKGNGGEMVLDTPWEQVPAVFTHLAECSMSVAAFTVRVEHNTLQLALQLERVDE